MEKWRRVAGFEDRYLVSSGGRVYSISTGRMKVQHVNQYGYRKVQLIVNDRNHTVFVHRLVAAAFHPPVSGKEEVNHKDGNKLNNHYSNLEWCDRSENTAHAYRLGLNPGRGRKGRLHVTDIIYEK